MVWQSGQANKDSWWDQYLVQRWGGAVVLFVHMMIIEQYDTVVLATPPWVEPQVVPCRHDS